MGIGWVVVEVLVCEGVCVVIVVCSKGKLEEVVKELIYIIGIEVIVVVVDVSNIE